MEGNFCAELVHEVEGVGLRSIIVRKIVIAYWALEGMLVIVRVFQG